MRDPLGLLTLPHAKAEAADDFVLELRIRDPETQNRLVDRLTCAKILEEEPQVFSKTIEQRPDDDKALVVGDARGAAVQLREATLEIGQGYEQAGGAEKAHGRSRLGPLEVEH